MTLKPMIKAILLIPSLAVLKGLHGREICIHQYRWHKLFWKVAGEKVRFPEKLITILVLRVLIMANM